MTNAESAGLLDTSTVILLGRPGINDVLPVAAFISAVTLAELSVGPLIAPSAAERAARQAHLQQAEADFEPLPFDAGAARAFAALRRRDERPGGRKPSARAFDALIAAAAIAHDLPLCTCNPTDSDGIDDLDVRAVPHPDH